MKKDVFISYNSNDLEVANMIKETLESNEISCWMAPDSISVESNYIADMPKEIDECKIFLLVLSKNSQESIKVSKEINEAINKRKTIIPFKIEDCELNDSFKIYLSGMQIINAYVELQKSLNDLVKIINANL